LSATSEPLAAIRGRGPTSKGKGGKGMEKARKRRRRGKRRGLPPLYLDSGYGLEEV